MPISTYPLVVIFEVPQSRNHPMSLLAYDDFISEENIYSKLFSACSVSGYKCFHISLQNGALCNLDLLVSCSVVKRNFKCFFCI